MEINHYLVWKLNNTFTNNTHATHVSGKKDIFELNEN